MLAQKTRSQEMTMKYYHDANAETVYAMEMPPSVTEQKDKRGRRTGWYVSGRITITRADNALLQPRPQWKYRVLDFPTQSFDAHDSDSESDVIGYFLMHHEPKGLGIDAETYKKLHAEYEAKARKNKP